MLETIEDFDIKPTSLSTGSPFLKNNKLGNPLIEYSVAIFKFSSVFIFTTFTLSLNSS